MEFGLYPTQSYAAVEPRLTVKPATF